VSAEPANRGRQKNYVKTPVAGWLPSTDIAAVRGADLVPDLLDPAPSSDGIDHTPTE